MKLFDLGHVPWLDSQLIYHALPRVGLEGLILLAPAEPYVCVGYHQDAEQEVDLAYCRENQIPVFRREVGGGAVYLDGQQLFYQLVIHKDTPMAPADKGEFYRRFLSPVVQAYRDLGVEACYRPVNDIITVKGRKISGNGAGEIGDFLVLVGNLIADFDYETMTRVLRVPDAKFRDKIFQSMRENLTTLRRELGRVPSWETMVGALTRSFGAALGPLTPADLPDSVGVQVAELVQTHTTSEWLLQPGRALRERLRAWQQAHPERILAAPGRSVKIAEGVEVTQRVHKATGGLIRTTVETQGGLIVAVVLSGDFFFFPAEKLSELERRLVGAGQADVEGIIEGFYERHDIESPGITPHDLAMTLGAAEPLPS
jgi:lipoate-protein ligase A